MTPAAYEPPRTTSALLRRLLARYTARDTIVIPDGFRCVTFTFDDFPKSAATTGREILEDFGWRGTWFASGCYASTTTHYGPMYDRSDLATLASAGHEIGSHTYSHLDCARSSEAETLADIQRNNEFLISAANIAEPVSFAFPYGKATPGLKKTLGNKFAGLRGVRRGLNRGKTDRRLIRSIPVVSEPERLAAALVNVQQMTESGGWLVYNFHDIQSTPTPWGCSPADFTSVLQAVDTAGASVKTFGEVLALLGRTRNRRE